MRFSLLHIFIVCVLLVGGGVRVHAQSQSISVTPPLFQLSIEPGDIWQSSVRVVNPNEYSLTVFAEVVNFAPDGEGGQGKFLPILNDDESNPISLAEWIEVPEGPHVIPPGQTIDVTFFVDVPEDAPPGGHFAAILISTEPPRDDQGPVAVSTTQTVTSLFFVRIEGDILEKALIRELSVLPRSVEEPHAEFSLRFENKGNVHVQPRGSIRIYNMWGKERGVIPINSESHFGNVLPESIRDFRFAWTGERSLADIGRYTAEASLAYGENGSQTALGETSFWVLPIRGALITFGVIAFFVIAIVWMIRLYIRRMLILAGIDPDEKKHEKDTEVAPKRSRVKAKPVTYKTATLPLTEGTAELRDRLTDSHSFLEILVTFLGFVRHYKFFFLAVLTLVALFVGLVLYIGHVTDRETSYEIQIQRGDRVESFTQDEVETMTTE